MRYDEIETSLTRSLRRHIGVAMAAGTLCLGGLAAVCFYAQINGAVVAPGQIIVAGRAKQVQHPDGGIVSEILVAEGQRVDAGQVLFRLDGTLAHASLGIVESQLAQLVCEEARLLAEQARAPLIAFPEEIAGMDTGRAPTLIEGQRALFVSRAAGREGRKSQLAEQVVQFRNQIAALEQQKAAVAESISLMDEQVETASKLRSQDLLVKSQLNVVLRERVALLGNQSAVVAQVAEAAQKAAEAEMSIVLVDEQFDEAVLTELSKTRAEIARLRQERIAAQDKLARLEIRAPLTGYLHEMEIHTVGGVIGGGEQLVSIIPVEDRLLVEARIAPTDIDQVYLGQVAQLQMTGLNTRTVPKLAASVVDVSADLTVDQHTGASYYNARLEIDPKALSDLGAMELRPGMPLEAFISTAERPVIEYLLQPITEQLRHALRES